MMIFQIAAGLVGAVLCAALGYFVLEKAFRIPYGSMILWILCPALILRCMQSVLLGIFQSEGSEMPSAVSAILRQLFWTGPFVFGDFSYLWGKSQSSPEKR